MNMFWKKKKYVDERIINAKNKIFKETFTIAITICIISIAVKYYFYGLDFKQFASEVVIIVVSSLFFTIRSVLLGLYSDEVEMHDRNSNTPMSTKYMVIGVVSGVFLALFFGIRSSILYAQDLLQRVVYFAVVFFVCLMIYCPFFIAIVVIPYRIGDKVSKKLNSGNDDSSNDNSSNDDDSNNEV